MATVSALDIIKLATKAGRALDGGTTITDVDVLGTDDLSDTNAAFIGALDGKIQGEDGLTFSADSKAMVFKFQLNGATQASKTISYLAGNQEIYQKDANGNFVLDADGNKQSPPPPKAGMQAMKEKYDKCSTSRTTTWSNTARQPPTKKMTTAM